MLAAQNTEDKEKKGDMMYYHKSLGVLTGILLVPRLGALIFSKRPAHMEGIGKLEQLAGSAGHLGLYGFSVVMSVTGIAMGYFSGMGLPFFGTKIPGAAEPNKPVAMQLYKIHKFAGYWGKFLIPAHVGAAGLHVARGHPIFTRINPF